MNDSDLYAAKVFSFVFLMLLVALLFPIIFYDEIQTIVENTDPEFMLFMIQGITLIVFFVLFGIFVISSILLRRRK